MGRARTSAVPKGGSRERLQRILARAGLSSRREAERWIEEGRVRVNGHVVRRLGSAADPGRDAITVDGKPLPGLRPLRTYVLYKPRGVVTTTRDPRARKTVLDLVPRRERLFPVGRLDAASEGLLLLTNDGALAHRLMHPSFEVPRVYRVSVQGRPGKEALAALREGQLIEGRRVVPRKITVRRTSGAHTVLEVTLIEGRRRQIRTMMREAGHSVRRLVRIRFGPVQLGTLAPGTWRLLRVTERQKLERMLDAAPQIARPENRRSR